MSADRPAPLPWDEVMRVGLGVLKLPPGQFWAMTPREFAAAAGALAPRAGGPPARNELERMMQMFPDRTNDG